MQYRVIFDKGGFGINFHRLETDIAAPGRWGMYCNDNESLDCPPYLFCHQTASHQYGIETGPHTFLVPQDSSQTRIEFLIE